MLGKHWTRRNELEQTPREAAKYISSVSPTTRPPDTQHPLDQLILSRVPGTSQGNAGAKRRSSLGLPLSNTDICIFLNSLPVKKMGFGTSITSIRMSKSGHRTPSPSSHSAFTRL